MSKTNILVVEDDGIVAADIERRLKKFGYFVSGSVSHGRKAIEKVEKLNPDLVLMDIVLKGDMDGIEAAEIIQARLETPVIYITAHADEKRIERAKGTNPFGYIIKPFRDRDLKITIEMALYKAKIDEARRQDKDALQKNEEKYRDLYENAPDMFISVDLKTECILDCNQTLIDATGYTKEEIIGRPIFDMYTPDSAEHAKSYILPMFAETGIVNNEELQIQRKDGNKIDVSLNVSAVRDGEGKIIESRSIWRDISKQKNLEAQLQQLQKMETIGTFAGGIAHDFNNILGPIIGCAELSLEDVPKGTNLYEYLQQILTAGMRAKDLVQQILTFSRQTDHELKPLRVQTIIEEVIMMSRSMLPSTIEIQQYISSQCGLVMADGTQIHQIAMNLITNAYHAMQATGGKLKVLLTEVDLSSDDLKNTAMFPGTYVCLTVTDTGTGMDKATLDQIFYPYFTTKGKDKGTGLGLAVLHGIVKSYKGKIRVHSELGKGTTFHVYLPRMQTITTTRKAESIIPIKRGNERILLVDDDEPIVRIEKQRLEHLGYHVTSKTNSTDALKLFQAGPHKFDLVVTDMTMPNMTGVELSRNLLEIRPDIPIIICTGFSELIDEERAAALGIRGYVMKPIVTSEIANRIRDALGDD